MDSLIFIVILFIFVWLLLILPSRRRQRSHKAMQDSVGPGDEVITAGGIHGVVRDLDGEELRVEIAPDVLVKLDRRAVAAVARELPPDGAADETPQAAS
jgi:preprotein translocase subunit YajC